MRKFSTGQTWLTRGGEAATILAITDKFYPIEVRVGARSFKNLLDKDGFEPEIGKTGRDSLAPLLSEPDDTALNTVKNDVLDQILALGLVNPHSTYDVEADDVYTYFEEAQTAASVQGFQDWLNA